MDERNFVNLKSDQKMATIYLIICLILGHLTNVLAANEPPVIQELQMPSKNQLKEGKKLFLNCQATGSKPLYFSWSFNGNRIENGENIFSNQIDDDVSALTIKSLKFENLGLYSCLVQNSHGQDSANLKIEFKGEQSEIRFLNSNFLIFDLIRFFSETTMEQ